nr:hypothetical protein [Xanthomonas populi]
MPLRFRRQLLQALIQRLHCSLGYIDECAVNEQRVVRVGRSCKQTLAIADRRKCIDAGQMVQLGLVGNGPGNALHLHPIEIATGLPSQPFQMRHRLREQWVVPPWQLLLPGQIDT